MYIPTNLSQKTASRGQTLNSGASVTNTIVRVRVRVNGKCLSLSLTSQCAYLSSLWPYYKLFVMEGELNWGGEDERTISRYMLDYLPLPTSSIWKDGETEADETFTQKDRTFVPTHTTPAAAATRVAPARAERTRKGRENKPCQPCLWFLCSFSKRR